MAWKNGNWSGRYMREKWEFPCISLPFNNLAHILSDFFHTLSNNGPRSVPALRKATERALQSWRSCNVNKQVMVQEKKMYIIVWQLESFFYFCPLSKFSYWAEWLNFEWTWKQFLEEKPFENNWTSLPSTWGQLELNKMRYSSIKRWGRLLNSLE